MSYCGCGLQGSESTVEAGNQTPLLTACCGQTTLSFTVSIVVFQFFFQTGSVSAC